MISGALVHTSVGSDTSFKFESPGDLAVLSTMHVATYQAFTYQRRLRKILLPCVVSFLLASRSVHKGTYFSKKEFMLQTE